MDINNPKELSKTYAESEGERSGDNEIMVYELLLR